MKKRIAIWAHGSKYPDRGFSGGGGLLDYFHSHANELDAEIVLVVSPFDNGSAAMKTDAFNIQSWSSVSHVCMTSYAAEDYQKVTEDYSIDLHFFSGWLKLVRGINPFTAVNIHPGPIQSIIGPDGQVWNFGGKGMRGDYVYHKVWEAYYAGVLHYGLLSMHYMTEQFDDPRYLIGQVEVPILDTDRSWEEYKKRARSIEPLFQQYVCHQLANGKIRIENDQVVVDSDVAFPGGIFGELLSSL